MRTAAILIHLQRQQMTPAGYDQSLSSTELKREIESQADWQGLSRQTSRHSDWHWAVYSQKRLFAYRHADFM